MRKFVINVNGRTYEVEVEEVLDGVPVKAEYSVSTPTPAPAAVSAPKAEAPAPEKKEVPNAAGGPVPAGASTVNAPMPGTILDIQVNVGDTVAKGQVLLILEAMKMENEIMAPKEGKVVSIQTTKGASVNPGDVLVAIE